MLNLVYAANVYAFCLMTSKDSSMGEFDESLIRVFFIDYLSLFYLDFMCFYFLFRTILLKLQVI
jgi:hypothetical protein